MSYQTATVQQRKQSANHHHQHVLLFFGSAGRANSITHQKPSVSLWYMS